MLRGNTGKYPLPRSLIAIVVASLLVKLAMLFPAHTTLPFMDALDYVLAALGLVHQGSFDSLRAPGYPAAMAAVLWIAEMIDMPVPHGSAHLPPEVTGINGYDLVRFIQVLLSTLTVVVFYRLVIRFFDGRAAIAAAGVIAFYPNLIVYSHLLWTETLFIFLLVWGLHLASRAAHSGSLAAAAGCGAILGLSALTREIGLLVAAVAATWTWLEIATVSDGVRFQLSALMQSANRARATRAAAIVLIAAGLIVLPWTVRNAFRHGEFVMISASGGVGLLFGATDDPMGELRRTNDPSLRFDGLKRDRRSGELAREIIRTDPVAWFKRCLTTNVPSLFQPVFDGLMIHLLDQKRGYGLLPTWLIRAHLVLLVSAYAALVVTTIVGVWLAGERRYTALFVGLLLAYIAAHVPILGVTRHRLPLEVLAAAFAGFTISRSRDELRQAATAPRLAGVMFSLALMASIVAISPTERAAGFWKRAQQVSANP